MNSKYSIFITLLASIFVSTFIQFATSQSTGVSRKVNVIPRCGSQLITIEIQFAEDKIPSGKFTDWIIVGDTERPECRLRGNGELQYVVEIAVFNDPCETKMITPGVFQNTIRIAQIPAIVLQDDFNFTVKCIYGLPEVQEHQQNRLVNPTFDIAGNLIPEDKVDSGSVGFSPTPFNSFPISREILSTDQLPSFQNTVKSNPDSSNGPFGVVTGGIPNEQKPSDSSGASTSSSPGSNNLLAVLLTIFIVLAVMIMLVLLFVCLRHKYLNELEGKERATSTNTEGTMQEGKKDELWWSGKGNTGGTFLLPAEYRVNRTPSGVSRDERRTHTSYTSAESDDVERHSVRAIDCPEDSLKDSYRKSQVREAFRNRSTPTHSSSNSNGPSFAHRDDPIDEDDFDNAEALQATQSYAQWREKMLKTDNRGPMGDSRYDKGETSPRCLTPVRSITEIYRSAETHLQKLMTEVDGGHSSDEGGYSLPRRDQDPLDGSTLDKLVKCVDKIRGFGSRKLTEQEISRWRQLIMNDINLQQKIMNAKTLDELKAMCEHPDYRLYFTRTKWSHIMQCVAEILFNTRFASPAGSFSMGTAQRQSYVMKRTDEENPNGSMLNVYVGNMSTNPGWS